MPTTQTTEVQAAIIERFLAAAERQDLAAMAELVHPDVTMEWPQSGERFRGRDNALAAVTATEVKPEMAGEPTVLGGDDLWVIRMPLRYGTDVYHYVGLFEFEGGLIRRTTEFFAAPFPAPESRAAYVER